MGKIRRTGQTRKTNQLRRPRNKKKTRSEWGDKKSRRRNDPRGQRRRATSRVNRGREKPEKKRKQGGIYMVESQEISHKHHTMKRTSKTQHQKWRLCFGTGCADEMGQGGRIWGNRGNGRRPTSRLTPNNVNQVGQFQTNTFQMLGGKRGGKGRVEGGSTSAKRGESETERTGASKVKGQKFSNPECISCQAPTSGKR